MTASAGEMLDVVAARRKLLGNVVRTAICWTWRQPTKGEPRLRLAGREIAATHAIWFVVYREWPPSTRYRRLAHLCGNSLCLRPRHLDMVSVPEYMRLRFARSEQSWESPCRLCGKLIHVSRSRHLRGWGQFCSRPCYSKARSGTDLAKSPINATSAPAERHRLRPSQVTGTSQLR
jgi:hypothetical protein